MTGPEALAARHRQEVEEAVAFLRERLDIVPQVGVILGTGLGGLATGLVDPQMFPYRDIPHFPLATVEGHAGNLVCGRLGGRGIAILQGRFHHYEGYPARVLTLPVRVLSLLGIKTFIVTNAAGGLNPNFCPGTVMVVDDHINLIPDNPLRGENIGDWGPRFPDMSRTYDAGLCALAHDCGRRLGAPRLASGVYVAIPGPSLETPAETRMLRILGADAVGMSSVPEVIVARHAGARVLGLSLVANVNDPDCMAPILLEDIIRQAAAAEIPFQKLIEEIIQCLPQT